MAFNLVNVRLPANLNWDAFNNRLGINTATPLYTLHATGNGYVSATFYTSQFVLLSRGATTTNAITYTGDANTGIYFPSDDTLGFSTSGAEQLRINSVGSIICNTTTGAFTPPKVTTTEKNAIGTPSAGMVVYDTTLNKLCVYTGAAWETVTSA